MARTPTTPTIKNLIIYPILFAISPILFFFSYNKTELSLLDQDFLISLALSVGTTLLAWLVLKLIIKDGKKAAIITSLAVILFFTYGHIEALMVSNLPKKITNLGPDKIMLSVCALAFLLGSYLVIRTKSSLTKLGTFLTVVAAFTIILSLIDIVPYEIHNALTRMSAKEGNATPQESVPTTPQTDLSKLPDIYYLIFDRYGNDTSLKNYFGFDNSAFLNYLKNQGFYVARESTNNYPRTYNSIASSLNMTYLDQLSAELGEEYQSNQPLYNMMENNEIIKFLKGRGYKYIHLGTWYAGTKKNKNADITFNYFSSLQSDFLQKLLEDTALNPILRKLAGDDPNRVSARKATLYEFDHLAEIPKTDGPKFVFAHILLPHEPYVFDQNGNAITQEQANKNTEAVNYINQLLFANKKIKELVGDIISESKNPPVIVIQSDEGPFTEEWGGVDKGKVDLRKISVKGLQTHMRILNAYYLPNLSPSSKKPYQSITPVNTFRLIFDDYFKANLKLLPDRSYIFQDAEHLYKFIDVTQKVKF